MVDFASRLLGPNAVDNIDFSKKLLSNSGPEKVYVDNPYMRDTGEISTITGKPIREPSTTEYQPADFKTMMKAGFVDDNDSKIKIFAEARGISPSDYEINGGRIYFKGADGKFYSETPKEFFGLLKKMVAELPSESMPDMAATVGGVFGGPLGAAAGGATGELARKEIGRLFFGDQQGLSDYALDLAVNGVLGGLDAAVARKMAQVLGSRKIKKATGGKLSEDLANVVGELSPGQRADAVMARRNGESIGVDLLPHQAYEDPTLTGYYSMLRDNPKTARQVRTSDKNLDQQVKTAGERLVESISPTKKDPFEIGSDLAGSAAKQIKNMKETRSAAVRDLYDIAKETTNVDAQPVLERIADLKQDLTPDMKAFKGLSRIERMLQKKAIDPVTGKEVIQPESRLAVINNVKKEIDAILDGPDAPAISADTKRRMADLKDVLTGQADAVSREYRVGRALYESASPKIDRAEKSILGKLARARSDGTAESAVSDIFSSKRSIRMAKDAVEKQDPQLWRDTVAEYLSSNFKAASKVTQGSGDNVINRPGRYFSRMWQLDNRDRIRVATEGMTDGNGRPLFDTISDFFDVMGKAAIGHGKESATQPRQKMVKDLTGNIGAFSDATNKNFRTVAFDFIAKNSEQKAFDRNATKLLDLMQTPEGVDLIAMAKGYGPKTEQGMKALTTFILMAGQSNFVKGAEVVNTAIKDE